MNRSEGGPPSKDADRDDSGDVGSRERKVDDILDSRDADRNHPGATGRAGEITNPDTQHQETVQDRGETDPFHES